MALLKPVGKMTPEELEARIRWHESMADWFELMRESIYAAKIRSMASKYEQELIQRRSK